MLLDRIGSGGMAEVFRAVMPGVEGFQRTFVVKRILAERAQSPYFVDMFVQEARINALLHHPNIVQVFDFGNVGGTYFLAMEYVRGRDVSAILRRLRNYERPCPVGVAAFIAHEVAQALGYAHALAGADGDAVQHRSPRRQPVEHHLPAGGRGEAARLRHRQGARRAGGREDGAGPVQGKALVHRAGADQGPAARRPVGSVLARRRAVGAAGGAEAVSRQERLPDAEERRRDGGARRRRRCGPTCRRSSIASSPARWRAIRRSATRPDRSWPRISTACWRRCATRPGRCPICCTELFGCRAGLAADSERAR